jgi:DNA-binding GntR family transcriptional regulator
MATAATPSGSQLSQRDQGYLALRRLLVLQKIPEGARLSEPEWAERLEINRSALREAFARLEAEGFIVRGKTSGYFVPRMSDEDIAQVIQVRCILECGAIEMICAAEGDRDAILKPAAEACDEFESLVGAGYLLGVAEADRRFHEFLIDAAGNPRLTMLYTRAPLPLIQSKIVSEEHFMEIARDVIIEHRSILAALHASDAAEACALLRRHLTHRCRVPLKM